jgi:hypothetical protein
VYGVQPPWAGRSTRSTNDRWPGGRAARRGIPQWRPQRELNWPTALRKHERGRGLGRQLARMTRSALPFGSVGVRRVPGRGAESRQPDGNGTVPRRRSSAVRSARMVSFSRRSRWQMTVSAAMVALSACASVSPPPPLPRGPDAWLIFDVDVPGRDSRELLRSFQASARAFGCTTGKGGGWATGMPGGGTARVYSAVMARCEEGTIGMALVDYGRVRLACPKPATREQCEALLGQISVAR